MLTSQQAEFQAFLNQGFEDMRSTLATKTIITHKASGRAGVTLTGVLVNLGGTYSVELGGSMYVIEFEACCKVPPNVATPTAGDWAEMSEGLQSTGADKFLIVESVRNTYDGYVHLKLARV